MNGNPKDPNITGVPNIVKAYKDSINGIGMGGPTLFAPILNEFLNYVNSLRDTQQYPIMLILTDGAIHDMTLTRDLIYKLSKKPCSVIIIGVGNADFTAMDELDGDGGSLTNCLG